MAVTFLALFLLGVVSSKETTNVTQNLTTSVTAQHTTSPLPSSSSPTFSSSHPSSTIGPPCAPSNAPPPLSAQGPPAPAVLVYYSLEQEGHHCRGVVYLKINTETSRPVCAGVNIDMGYLCRGFRCGGVEKKSKANANGPRYNIQNGTAVDDSDCEVLEIHCKAGADHKQLVAYKTVTGLLCVLVLAFVLVRFGPHIYSTVTKRLLGRRKREWIGPTESQSVSFYRAQAGLHPNNNTDKRLSFPGLERLTVYGSREPSSNRNSDYDSYN